MKFAAFRRLFIEDYKGETPKEEWFSSFLSNLNSFFDQAATALRNGLTFADNFRGLEKYIDFTTMVEEQVAVTAPVNAVLALQGDENTMVEGLAWRPIKPGLIGVTIKHSRSAKTAFKIRIEY